MIRIGAGAGFASDRIEPAVDLVEEGDVDYLVLECLGERTVATAQRRKQENRSGYGPYFEDRVEALLEPAVRNGTTIVTNDGAAEPLKAGEFTARVAAEEDLPVDVSVVTGDDCSDVVDVTSLEEVTDERFVSANAYLGSRPIVEALSQSGDDRTGVVITGRVADPSLYVAPLVHEFDWAFDDWDRLGQATVIGHLMECAGQVTGGFFMEPDRKPVPEPHLLGPPFVDVEPSGEGVIGKVDGTGGRIDTRTCREQLFYEIHDPSAYVTPDTVADFTNVDLQRVDEDRVRVTGGRGRPAPDDLKVSVGFTEGFQVQCYRAYGEPNAEARARLAGDIVRKRIEEVHGLDVRLRVDIVGVDALFGPKEADPAEVLLRVTARSSEETDVETVYREVSAIALNGPAAASTFYPEGRDAAIQENVGIVSDYVPREEITTRCHQIA